MVKTVEIKEGLGDELWGQGQGNGGRRSGRTPWVWLWVSEWETDWGDRGMWP